MIKSIWSFDMSWGLFNAAQTRFGCIVSMVHNTMWIELFFVSCTSFLVNGYGNEDILGKGRWLVLNTLECDNPEQYDIQLEISRRKINRTHDAFSLRTNFDREINVSYGVEAVANKEVDGGYKYHSTLSDDSLCNVALKYGGDNWPLILAKAKVDPPECPIPEGPFEVEDYVINYEQLEETGMYGKYDANIYMTYIGQRVACARLLVQFEKKRDDDDGDDDDDDYE